jgi:hypothetical protein
MDVARVRLGQRGTSIGNPRPPANTFAAAERMAGAAVYALLDGYRRLRDAWSEQLFTRLYGTG